MKRKKSKNSKKQPSALSFKFSDLFSADYRIITALLIILPLLIYAQVYNFEILWDDDDGAGKGHLHNAFVVKPSWASFTQLFTQPYFDMYIPVSYSLLGILKAFAELLSLPINSVLHLGNVMVHIVNGLLVFTILKQFIVNKWAVLIGVLFFLLHPIQVEAVAWISEFRGLLATIFVLLSLYYYLKNQANLSYLALIFFVLAVLSKPSAVVLVPFMFLLNYYFKIAKNIQKTLPFALIALIFVLITSSVQLGRIDFAQHSLDFWQRPFVWLDSIIFYIYKIIYPYHLSASYTLSPKFISVQWWFYPLALVPLALGVLLWLKREKYPLLVFSSVLFISGFFLTSGFVSFAFQRHSLVADRYVYFAMIGIALLIGTIFSKVDKKIWQGLIISVLIVFASLSAFRQIPIWQNSFELWSHSINYEATPQYAHFNLGFYFNGVGTEIAQAGKYQQAIVYFDKAIKVYPKNYSKKLSEAIFNKSLALLKLKKYQQALDSFNQAIKIDPNNVNANNGKIDALTSLVKHFSNKGREFASAGKHQQAIVYFDKAINITPPNNKKYLAILFSNKGRAFANMGKYQQAADSFDKEIKHYPQDDISDRGTAFYNKGLALLKLKKQQQALEHFNQAIKINPTNAAAHNANIDVLIIIKQCKKAKQAFAFALQHKIKLREVIAKNLHKVCP